MGLQLYNTLTRRKEAFQPVDPTNVRMYVCGPTVYQRIHIGNARPLIVFDVLFRLLRQLYGEQHVTYVRNITDIDDKIIDQARKNGEPIEALTERTTRDLHADIAALGCLPPTHEPRATQHVPGMVQLIEKLIAQGHAYAAEGHVLFSVPSMPAYGRLSGRNRDDQIAGARVDVAPYKRDPADFVLWKPSPPDLPGWASPWGRGRPGWHIECSAMSEVLLSPLPFDIHGGGLDLIFPHHENEIAQSCCAHGLDRMANIWMHNGFVEMRGEKMSKSLGNTLNLKYAFQRESWREVWRLWLLGTHYRQPIDFTQEALDKAKSSLRRLYSVGARVVERKEGAKPDRAVVDALLDDVNTPAALARLDALRREVNVAEGQEAQGLSEQFLASCRLLGLLWSDERLEDSRRRTAEMVAVLSSNIAEMDIAQEVERRSLLRKQRKWKEADYIRADLEKKGIILEDTPTGTTWRRA